ncbi:MAG: serine/threonine protein phosphatase [Rhodospirillales bacterium]|jgi:serine/threonine protein phosphatase 1|nr:serine/threonine protein phosphatase [Rhodospirillales bacterium]
MLKSWLGLEAPAARVPPGRRVYAIGDIHGRDDLLERLLQAIRADAATAGDLAPVAVFLGDYVDRGPMSFEVIDRLINEPLPGFRHVFLKGNHEAMMLDFLAGPPDALWFDNGGFETLLSYGLDGYRLFSHAAALEEARQALNAALPAAHRRFLEGLALSHVEGDYAFVHAGLRPGVALAEQRDRDLLWIRGPFLASREGLTHRVVHGHTIVQRPEVHANRIAIDTGAVYSGTLTSVVLEGASVRFLST